MTTKKAIKEQFKCHPYPGLRNIKTAISIVICFIIYEIIHLEGVSLSCTSALICMQDSLEKSKREGLTRIVGTALGGLFGFLFAILNSKFPLPILIIFVGNILLIYLCNLFALKNSIIMACVVFLSIILSEIPDLNILFNFTVTQIINSLIGIIVAIFVNRYIFPRKTR